MKANNSWRTAIVRRKLSKPIRRLIESGLINPTKDKVLDFGCGRGFDALSLGFTAYDPHFFPTKPKGTYDIIVCNFVLNVLPESFESDILTDIRCKLRKGGRAYITVRRDIKKTGYTKNGTYQRNVVLTNASSLYKDSDLEIYTIQK